MQQQVQTLLLGLACSFAIAIPVESFAEREAKSRPGHRGYGTSRPCPWNCELAGLPKDKCKDWRSGGMCYVEDFTRPPRQGPEAPLAQNDAAGRNLTQPNTSSGELVHSPAEQPVAAAAAAGPDSPGYKECRSIDPTGLGSPRIEIADVERSGSGFFGGSDRYRITGSVEGVCLVEAGLFEEGEKVENIPIATSRDFRRFQFDVKARTGEAPEIRAYNINGQRDVIELDRNR
jgi:hypothetical protein